MNTEVMEKKQGDGDVEKLEALMRQDQLTLARVSLSSCFNQTPLHLACMLGHFEFAKSLLFYKPDFACRLDSQGRSALHLASANGYVNIVGLLLQHDLKMCRVHDEDGRTPLHLAVMNGQHESVNELMKDFSECDRDGTELHLCVMYNRLNVLVLMLELSNDRDLSIIKDDGGNTILHSAAALRRIQMIKYLVISRSEVLDVNAVNNNGLTALDVVEQMPKDVKTMEIKELLISSGTLRAKEMVAPTTVSGVSWVAERNIEGSAATDDSKSKWVKMWKKLKSFTIFQEKQEKRDKTLLVAASVIAAMAYQAAISPPGGVAGMDATKLNSNSSPITETYDLLPAYDLLAFFYSGLSNVFWISNTISFMASLIVIFLFVSGVTLKQMFYIWLIRAAMWITLSSMTVAYACAVLVTSHIRGSHISCCSINRTISMGGKELYSEDNHHKEKSYHEEEYKRRSHCHSQNSKY